MSRVLFRLSSKMHLTRIGTQPYQQHVHTPGSRLHSTCDLTTSHVCKFVPQRLLLSAGCAVPARIKHSTSHSSAQCRSPAPFRTRVRALPNRPYLRVPRHFSCKP